MMETSIGRLYSLSLHIFTNRIYYKLVLLGTILACLFVWWLLGTMHHWALPVLYAHNGGPLNHVLDDHDPWD